MSYIEKNLAKDEKLLIFRGISPLFVWPVVIMWLFAALICLICEVPLGFVCFGLIGLFTYLHYKSIEMAITNKRIVVKRGIISTKTDEIRLEKCESVNLQKGVLGVIFNFGNIIFTGTGNASLKWDRISDPKDTRKQIEDVFETYRKK